MNKNKAREWLERAGFTVYQENSPHSPRPYLCYKHEGCNSFTSLLYTDMPPNTVLEIIFSECKKVGRIQLRQELNHMFSHLNYE